MGSGFFDSASPGPVPKQRQRSVRHVRGAPALLRAALLRRDWDGPPVHICMYYTLTQIIGRPVHDRVVPVGDVDTEPPQRVAVGGGDGRRIFHDKIRHGRGVGLVVSGPRGQRRLRLRLRLRGGQLWCVLGKALRTLASPPVDVVGQTKDEEAPYRG